MKRIFLFLLGLPYMCSAQDSAVQIKVLTAYILVQKYIDEDTSVQKGFAEYVRAFAPPKFGEITYYSDGRYISTCQCIPAQNVMMVIPEKITKDLPKHVFEPVDGKEGMLVLASKVKTNENIVNASELLAGMIKTFILQKYDVKNTQIDILHVAGDAWRRRFLDFYDEKQKLTYLQQP